MAGMAYRYGLHPSEEYRGTEDIRYGVFLISYASSSRYQTSYGPERELAVTAGYCENSDKEG